MGRIFRQAALASWLALVLLVAMALPAWAQGDEFGAGSRTVDIYLTVEPKGLPEGSVQMPGQEAVTAPGEPVRISGLTSREFAGQQVAVTVEPPEWEEPTFEPEVESEDACEADNKATPLEVVARQEPTVEMAEVDVNGRFEVEFTPKVEGKHRVKARDASRVHEGEAEFEVVDIELELKCYEIPVDEIEEQAAALIKNVCDVTDALAKGLVTLPDSPAKTEFERQLKQFQEHRAEVIGCDEAPRWSWAFRQINDLTRKVPELAPTIKPIKDALPTWQKGADEAAERGPKVLASLTQANLLCDNLDLLVNGLKYVEFILGMLTKPGELIVDWGKENLPPKLMQIAATSISRNSLLKDTIETGWKNIVGYKPTLSKGKIKIGIKGNDMLVAHQKLAWSLASYASSRVFDVYCQSFSGPMTATMEAEFYAPNGDIWWRYTIDIKGKLVLRYPSDAKGKQIRLTGEFIGNAISFDSSDNAVPVLFPELAMSTVFRTYRIEPLAAGTVFEKNFGVGPQDGVSPDMNPISSTLIESGGTITQSIMTPAFFKIPVKAELNDKKMIVELLGAIEDFDERVKVIQIILPVLSMRPDVIDYALPYKGAEFMLGRASRNIPMTLDVQETKGDMKIEGVFTNEKGGPEAHGWYHLHFTACNPGC